jgi:hypothetical protein
MFEIGNPRRGMRAWVACIVMSVAAAIGPRESANGLDTELRGQADDAPANASSPLGKVIGYGNDLAVLELTSEGPELPLECTLAGPEEFLGLPGQAIGLLAYPWDDGFSRPSDGERPTATYACGTIGKMLDEDFHEDGPIPLNQRSLLSYTPRVGNGGSGSPVFRANGHIVGVTVAESCDAESAFPTIATRVDKLRELLHFHGLTDAEPGSAAQVEHDPEWQIEQLRHAVELVRDAVRLRRAEDYAASQARCDEALTLAPEYGRAFLERSKVYLFCAGLHWDMLAPALRHSYVEQAWRDSSRAVQLCPHWNEAYPIYLQTYLYCYHIDRDTAVARAALDLADQLARNDFADSDPTLWEQSFLANLRGQAHHFLGENEKAEDRYAESIRLAPKERRWYLNRAQFYEEIGKPTLAARNRRWADEVSRGEPVDEMAKWPSIPTPAQPTLPNADRSPFDIDPDDPPKLPIANPSPVRESINSLPRSR